MALLKNTSSCNPSTRLESSFPNKTSTKPANCFNWPSTPTTLLLELASRITTFTECTPLWKYELRPAVEKLYQLRTKATASSVSVASRVFNPKHTSCVTRLVRNCISCIERQGCTKCPTIWRFLYSVIVLCFIYNYMHTYRIVEWYRQHSCYTVLRSNV